MDTEHSHASTPSLLRLTAYPRLHLALIDCAGASSRVFGGIGVSIASPPTVITVAQSDSFAFSHAGRLEDRTVLEVEELYQRFTATFEVSPVSISLTQAPLEHRGFGSKTALLLGVAFLIAQTSGLQLSESDLVALTRRGGTSGIGVHTFFRGGWIADAGHTRKSEDALKPSSFRVPERRAPLIFNSPVSESWRFHLLMPDGLVRSAQDEALAFAQNTPTSEEDALQTLKLVYHGLLPAIVEDDLESFGAALTELQSVGFKQREIQTQTSVVRRLLNDLAQRGFAAGMSSMGPLVFAVAHADDQIELELANIGRDLGCNYLGSVEGRNDGAIVEEEVAMDG